MMKCIIAAVADNMAIGKGNDIPWHISEDLRYFKSVTGRHPVIMGRKTFESIGKPLPGRVNIVLTHKYLDGVLTAHSLEEAYRIAGKHDDKCFVIGGAKVYSDAISDAGVMYITRVHVTVDDADAYFPEISDSEWVMISSDSRNDNGLEYDFEIYHRRIR